MLNMFKYNFLNKGILKYAKIVIIENLKFKKKS